MKKKYYYREGGKEEKLIEASSDSAAYLEAYKYFEISKKVHSDMKKSMGSTYLSAPITFELLNDKHEDITYKVSLANKDSLENSISKTINDLPNSIEQSVSKIREEKHGTGAKYDTWRTVFSCDKSCKRKVCHKGIFKLQRHSTTLQEHK
jgi:hypothetical protein